MPSVTELGASCDPRCSLASSRWFSWFSSRLRRAPPKGFSIRQVAAMPQEPVRVISDPAGTSLYVLCLGGDVYRIVLPGGEPTRVLESAKYAEPGQFLGVCLDNDGRMYLVGNSFD